MAQELAETPVSDPLDRTIDLSVIKWSTISIVVALAAGAALRLAQLDQHALSQLEASWAFDAYRFFRGAALEPGEKLPTTEPISLLANSLSFFLFGVTDATARMAGVLFGIGSMLPKSVVPAVATTAMGKSPSATDRSISASSACASILK